jgi:trimethylamine:corrinoid methyltransferase-like protein
MHDIAQVIQHGFQTLQKIGCRIELPAAQTALAAYGCQAAASGVMLCPDQVIWQALSTTGGYYKPQRAPVVVSGSCRTRLLDYVHRSSREGASEDVLRIIQLANGLSGITINAAGILPFDVPREATDVANTAFLCKYSKKPFWQDVYTVASGKVILRMLASAGSKEYMQMPYQLKASSPLRYQEESLAIAQLWSQARLPVVISSSPVVGKQSPASLADTLVQIASEWLAGIVYLGSLSHQSPVILHSVPSLYGEEEIMAAPELALLAHSLQQIAGYLGYPCWSASGHANLSWWDVQTGWEKALTMVLPWLDGSVLTGYAGLVGDDFSPEQLVLDNYTALLLQKLDEACHLSGPLSWQELTEIALHKQHLSPAARDGSEETDEINNSEDAHKLIDTIWNGEVPAQQLSAQQCQTIDRLLEDRLRELGE